jgi:hypothetical protein
MRFLGSAPGIYRSRIWIKNVRHLGELSGVTSSFSVEIAISQRKRYNSGMNSTAKDLDAFLREADPATARMVEEVVKRLLTGKLEARDTSRVSKSPMRYKLPTRRLGAREGLDLTKLAHVDEDL